MMQAWRIPAVAAAIAVVGCLSGPAAAQLSEARNTVNETTNAGARSQARIDEVAKDTQEILGNYRSVLRRVDDLRAYNEQRRLLIQSQLEEMQSIRDQIERVKTVEREIVPLMARMTDALEMFINLDTPFQIESRKERIARIRETQSRADVTLAEKFRLVLEAYQIESEYGRTIAAYEGGLGGGDPRKVKFMQVGRAALYYQTADKSESAIWNQTTRSWQILPTKYANSIETGIDMALERIPPDLMILPMFGPGEGLVLQSVTDMVPAAADDATTDDAGDDAASDDSN